MSLTTYQSHLNNIPKQHKFIQLFRPPIYVIEISNDQLIGICYYKDGSSKRHQVNADFSNRRMVIADFNKFSQALTDLLLKFPGHFLWMSAIAATDVTEILADGLTSIEVKVITEAFFVASAKAKRKTVHTAVSYQGKIVPLEKFG